MRRFGIVVALLLVPAFAYLCLWPVPVEPVAWVPDVNRGLTGGFADERGLAGLGPDRVELGPGPEDIARGPDGWFYAGLQDGRIVRFRPGDGAAETVVNTGGRPLGMQFDRTGRLIVADAFKGLLSVDPAGGAVSVLVDRVDGQRLVFTDDLDIAADGTIWFSNASQRFDQHHWILDFWEGRGTGQLLSHDPASGVTRVRLAGLRFANGVALGPEETYVLVNETMAARITRLWLKGAKAGQHDLFIDGLPGHPDNLSFNGRDLFWVALPSERAASFDRLAPHPWLRKLLLRLPESWVNLVPEPLGWVAGVDTTGRVRHSLRDRSGLYSVVTSANEYDGKLYLGSIAMNSACILELPALQGVAGGPPEKR